MPDDDKVKTYVKAAIELFSSGKDEVEEALHLIGMTATHAADALPIQLLAVRRYLRVGGKSIEANWSWTIEEAREKVSEEPGKTLYAEAEKVRRAFAAQNPGYSLAVSPIRSLERQVALWSQNSTVRVAGNKLLTRMIAELKKPYYPETPTGEASVRFSSVLSHATVAPEPSNAAPGTSDHGRGTAVDFVVMRGATTVAGTYTAQIAPVWRSGGWEVRLIHACSGTRLVGPLKTPYEPWHWVLGR
jgi:hypothetical protein